MCCTDQPNTASGHPFTMAGATPFYLQCGCGCIGKEHTAMSLDRYREHLKAELNHIDARIEKLNCDCE